MDVIGAAVGAMTMGRMADRLGRRPIVLTCLMLMCLGMLASASANSLLPFILSRLIAGLGLGGLNPAVTSMVSEMSNERSRDQSVALLGLGYTIGAIGGGATAAYTLTFLSWRWVFGLGAVLTSLTFMLALWGIPETPHHFLRKQPRNALRRLNILLGRMGYSPLEELPSMDAERRTQTFGCLFASQQLGKTVMLTMASLFTLSTFYFALKWLPKFAVDAGHSPSEAATVLMLFNVGGLAGVLAFGPVVRSLGLKRTTIGILLLSGAAILILGSSLRPLPLLAAVAFISGIFVNASFAGLCALAARAFDTDLRSTGIGFTLGIGRGGAALSPIAVGLLLTAGLGVPMVAAIFAGISALAGLLIYVTRAEH